VAQPDRRSRNPAVLVPDFAQARDTLRSSPQYSDMETIVRILGEGCKSWEHNESGEAQKNIFLGLLCRDRGRFLVASKSLRRSVASFSIG